MKPVLFALAVQILRYLLIAGAFYLLFYIIKKDSWLNRKIQQTFPGSRQIRREIQYSIISIVIFVAAFLLVRTATQHGYTEIYTDFHQYSTGYFLFSIVLMLLWHDTYFYWSHRLLHLRMFMRFHRLHHQSHNTTPWTSFSFHPIEALVQTGFVLVVFFIPLHPICIAIVMTWQMLFNVVGHLGYELVPLRFHKGVIGKLLNTSTHHNMHHRYVNSNYGLYFSIWDSIMKTHHPEYEKQYEESAQKMYNVHK